MRETFESTVIKPFTHEENQRYLERKRVNGQPYETNPEGLPYDNEGNLIQEKENIHELI